MEATLRYGAKRAITSVLRSRPRLDSRQQMCLRSLNTSTGDPQQSAHEADASQIPMNGAMARQTIDESQPIVRIIRIQTKSQNTESDSQQAELISETLARPYQVGRTRTKNLPVYEDLKGSGTLKLTKIQKLSGDSMVLKTELENYLRPKAAYVKVNPVTQHVIIKVICNSFVNVFSLTIFSGPL